MQCQTDVVAAGRIVLLLHLVTPAAAFPFVIVVFFFLFLSFFFVLYFIFGRLIVASQATAV